MSTESVQHIFDSLNTSDEKIRFLLEYAILAPSTHNTQPWLFKIDAHTCKIFRDSRLALPFADPSGRDMVISIGAAIENMIIAARYLCVFDSISYGPFSEDGLCAEVTFKNLSEPVSLNVKYGELFSAIPRRRNARGLFTKTAINEDVLDEIRAALTEITGEGLEIQFITDRKAMDDIASLTERGLILAHNDVRFRTEAARWVIPNISDRYDGIPGHALKAPYLLSFILPWLIRHINMGKKLGMLCRLSVSSAALVTAISTQEENIPSWIRVGRATERIMLELLARGFRSSVFVAAVEMEPLRPELAQILRTSYLPQFLFVSGQTDGVFKPTPRHPINDKILT